MNTKALSRCLYYLNPSSHPVLYVQRWCSSVWEQRERSWRKRKGELKTRGWRAGGRDETRGTLKSWKLLHKRKAQQRNFFQMITDTHNGVRTGPCCCFADTCGIFKNEEVEVVWIQAQIFLWFLPQVSLLLALKKRPGQALPSNFEFNGVLIRQSLCDESCGKRALKTSISQTWCEVGKALGGSGEKRC